MPPVGPGTPVDPGALPSTVGGCTEEKFNQLKGAKQLIEASEEFENPHGDGRGHTKGKHVHPSDEQVCKRACDQGKASSKFKNLDAAEKSIDNVLKTKANIIKNWATKNPRTKVGADLVLSAEYKEVVGQNFTCKNSQKKDCDTSQLTKVRIVLIFDPTWNEGKGPGCFWLLTGHPDK
jgi:hypothetical protein